MRQKYALAAAVAARQNGRATTRQLIDCGFTANSIRSGVKAGRLHRVHQGVYAVGHLAPSRLGGWHAAVLACGPEALLADRSAAALWQIREDAGPRIDVLVPSRNGRRRPGITIHRAPVLPMERRVHRNIPVTSPARTAIDLVHSLSDEDARRLLREMQYRRLFVASELEISNARRPSAYLNAYLEDLVPTDSPIEDAFLRLVVRGHGLPEPQCQVRVLGFRVDFLWPDAKLIVEVDGLNHGHPEMQQADRLRDNVLHLAGYLVLRYTARDVRRRTGATARQVEQALAGRIMRRMSA